MKNKDFDAIVLAGDRSPDDPLLRAAQVPAKALIPVGGRAMALRVLDTLNACQSIRRVVLVGPERSALEQLPELLQRVESGAVQWLPPEPGPSRSAATGIEFLAQQGLQRPILITTADHALLTSDVVEGFLQQTQALPAADVIAALVHKESALRAMPGSRRTGLKFREATYCGCNLFVLMSPQGQRVVNFWQRVEHLRKQPLKLLGMIGLVQAVLFRLGLLKLSQALEHLTRKTGARVATVTLSQGLAAVDVDSATDWRLVVRWLQQHPESVQASSAKTPEAATGTADA